MQRLQSPSVLFFRLSEEGLDYCASEGMFAAEEPSKYPTDACEGFNAGFASASLWHFFGSSVVGP